MVLNFDNYSDEAWEGMVLESLHTKYAKDLGFYPGKIGEFIGEGADGIVYEYGKKKIIKFIRPRLFTANPFSPKIFKFLQQNKKPFIAKIYRSGYFFISRQKVNYYIAERLFGHIGEKELNLLVEKLEKFHQAYGLKYTDIHTGNAMKDQSGSPKIIDLNSFYINNTRQFKHALGEMYVNQNVQK